jgi:hypothetical protein
VGWMDGLECCVFVFGWQVARASHIHSNETQATVVPLAFLDFHRCAVVLQCPEDAAKVVEEGGDGGTICQDVVDNDFDSYLVYLEPVLSCVLVPL